MSEANVRNGGLNRARTPMALVALVLAGTVLAGLLAPRAQEPTPIEQAADPAPVLSPEQGRALIRVADGFEVDLVASEPMIEDPVAMAFDEDGRLWVCEMRSYMPNMAGEGERVATSRIVVMDDTNGDGRMDASTVFADGLVMPRALAPSHGGLLVIEPPNLVFLRDTDGDGRADDHRVLLDGFGGLENPEHAGNGLMYGLDNWWELSQHGIRFRFDGETVETERVPVHGQWGITMDDEGLVYYAPNSDSLRGDVVPKRYAVMNPDQRGFAGINERIGRDVAIWPSHVTGINRGYQEHMRREDGTVTVLTAACGPVIYRASAFPLEYRGDAFVCEPSCNLVKRLSVTREEGLPVGRNAYEGREFLTSTDERFRPVNAMVGPDGGLYLVDMYRGLIQHRIYLTDYLAKHIRERGLQAPIGLGRIYRVRPAGWKPGERPHLSVATDEHLVELLAHPDGWWRDTAQRLLVERRATGVEDRLRSMTRAHPDRRARLHALWTLDGLGLTDDDDVAVAAGDAHSSVRVAALRIGEERLDDASLLALADELADDVDRLVRVQAALALTRIDADEAVAALAAMGMTHGNDRLVRSAVVCAARDRELAVLATMLDAENEVPRGLGADLADCAIRAGDEERVALCELIAGLAGTDPERASRLLERVEAAQRIGEEEPRRLVLAREPGGWSALEATPAFNLSVRATAVHHHLDWPGKPEPDPAPRPLTEQEQALFAKGEHVFATICAACHGPEGRGTTGQVPPLVGSARVVGPPNRLARILLHGLEGPLEHGGQTYSGMMPPAPLANDEEFAGVMTYIRRSWGHEADPVDPSLIAEVRAAEEGRMMTWTIDELEEIEP